MNRYLGIVLSVFALIFSAWMAWVFFINFGNSDPSIKAGLIGLFGVFSAGIITHYQTKKREINSRHFTEKRAAYTLIIDLFFDFLMAEKTGKNTSDKKTLEKIILFKKSLIIWGVTDVIEFWNELEGGTLNSGNEQESLVQIEQMLRSIRKDLGHNDNSLEFGNLAALLLISEEKHKAFKQ